MQLEVLPKNIRFLTLALCAYLAAPVYDIPLVSLSSSAPLTFLLLLGMLKLPGGLQLSRNQSLLIFIIAFNIALILAFAWNHFFTNNIEEFDEGLKYIIRFIYWVFCSSMAFRLFARTDIHGSVSQVISLALIMMSILIIAEFIFIGKMGDRSSWTLMGRNAYAWQFSTFLPFAYLMFVSARNKHKIFWSLGLTLCLVAIIALASRSGWGIALISFFLFVTMYTLALRQTQLIIKSLVLMSCLAGISWVMVPESSKETIFQKFDTFESLDRDKSWMIRELQVQKGLKIFDDYPVFGVGPGQFRYADVPLTLPEVFRGKSYQDYTDRSAHNSYIALLAEGGLALVVPFGSMLIWLAVAGMRAAIQLARFGETWGLALFSGFIGMSIHFWSLSGITSTAPWFIYGMMAAMIYRARWMKRTMLAQRRRQFEDEIALGFPLPRPR